MLLKGLGCNQLHASAQSVRLHAGFCVSAVFDYLGPSVAVLLLPVVVGLGVAWFRIASAALIVAPITQPWRTFHNSSPRERTHELQKWPRLRTDKFRDLA